MCCDSIDVHSAIIEEQRMELVRGHQGVARTDYENTPLVSERADDSATWFTILRWHRLDLVSYHNDHRGAVCIPMYCTIHPD